MLEKLWRLLAVPLILLIVGPLVVLFTRTTPALLWSSLGQPQVLMAIGVSLRTSLISLVIILVLGTPLAYMMSRKKFRLRPWMDAVIDLPTLLPPSVAGLALLLTFGRRGLLGPLLEQAGIQAAFSPIAVILVQVFISAPFYVRASTLGFAGIDVEIEQAAQLDGANRWQLFRFVILPLSRRALISGAMMSWARALGEFGATMIFAGNLPGITQTMPTAIYLGFEVDLQVALTLSVILVLLSLAAIILVKSLPYFRD